MNEIEISAAELLAYSDGERAKWHRWFEAHPEALAITIHPGGRFGNVGLLIDHIFLVERRHLQRLRKQLPLADRSGVDPLSVKDLFQYGEAERGDLSSYVSSPPGEPVTTSREFEMADGRRLTITPRKLILHVFFHEIRHWAQIALAVRTAGLAPPGDHDLLFSDVLA